VESLGVDAASDDSQANLDVGAIAGQACLVGRSSIPTFVLVITPFVFLLIIILNLS